MINDFSLTNVLMIFFTFFLLIPKKEKIFQKFKNKIFLLTFDSLKLWKLTMF